MRREWLPTPVFLPGEFHGQRSLAGYSSWGRRVRHDWVTNISLPNEAFCQLRISKAILNAIWKVAAGTEDRFIKTSYENKYLAIFENHFFRWPTFEFQKSSFFFLSCAHVQSLIQVWLFVGPWTVACQAPLSMEFSREIYWSGLPLPSWVNWEYQKVQTC